MAQRGPEAEELPMPISAHSGRDQGVDRHPRAASRPLEDQLVGGHELERSRITEQSGAELLDVRL